MLRILVQKCEKYDEQTGRFYSLDNDVELKLEHSLISLYKWEAKHKKPFMGMEKTKGETIDYIRCMTINKDVDPKVYMFLSDENITAVNAYIKDPMTATTISNAKWGGDGDGPQPNRINNRPITAELLYYWMFELNIWPEFEKRHLNQLITLIKVCESERNGGKKLTPKEAAMRNMSLNAQRRAALGSKG